MAGRKSFIIDKGTTWDPVITWKDANGIPYVLTNAEARLHIRAKITDAHGIVIGLDDETPIYAELSSEDDPPTILLGGAAGTIQPKLTAAQTAYVTVAKALYDLEVEFEDGTVRRVLEGDMTFRSEVTR